MREVATQTGLDPRFGLRARILEGEMLIATGAYDEAITVEQDAYFDASAAGDGVAEARALLHLVHVHAEYLRRQAEALAWSRHADATIERRFRRYGDHAGLAFWLFLTRDWVAD